VEAPPSQQWVDAWRDLAQATNGITKTDPRFELVCDALERCDDAFSAKNWPRFQKAADEVRRLVKGNVTSARP